MGLGEDLGQGWGERAIPHSVPCAWELPKAEQRQLNPKNPAQASKPNKIHPKRICGYFSTTGVKTHTV